ncbi:MULTISPECIES: hypothetical protein [unclassified Pseudoalteromonas]|uniref:hypothetical protein n=1 Tax=unclassified Pseudoalteromonas TaxID=194690 RepID=UPI0020971E50|nr:hypothetical protein [Pseudoalteromonas sp. XMcav2-N]MCO7188280.1 hypothetical protein [Pseudoalteromonas sp. XMcav2-N]
MSEITTKFKTVYQENNLSEKDYYLYGSGGGGLDILHYIETHGLRAPLAVLDREAKQVPFKVINAYEMQSVDHPVVVSSISFYGDIKHALVKYNKQFKSKLIPLTPYSDNVTNRLHISEAAWAEYQTLAETGYRQKHAWVGSQFYQQGFYIGKSDVMMADKLRALCNTLPECAPTAGSNRQDFDYFPTHKGTQHSHLQWLELSPVAYQLIQKFVIQHYDEVAEQLGSHWKIVNSEILKSTNASHTDKNANQPQQQKGPNAVNKLVLFISPPSDAVQWDDDNQTKISGPAGTFFLAQNCRLQYKSATTEQQNKFICELTIATSQYKDTQVRSVGQTSVFPYKPWQRCGAYKINLGGGANFNGENWICYDECDGANVEPISFTPKTVLPNPDGTCSLVYSSHFFEHINHETLANLLAESWRILQQNGDLLIKIPDFDAARTAGLEGDMSYFEQFSQSKEKLKSWYSYNVDPRCTLTHAANVITSFWDADYGHLYKDQGADRAGYCGPAKLSSSEYAEIFKIESINEISKILTEKIRNTESNFQFNHQNAWTKDEFIALVCEFGFELVSTDYDLIDYAFPDVPDFSAHKSFSNYYYFKKITS